MYSRESYKNIKIWFLENAYISCQNEYRKKIPFNDNVSEWGYALDAFLDVYRLPIENLMLYVVYATSNCRRNEFVHNNIINNILSILEDNTKNELFDELHSDEKDEFLYDLNTILKYSGYNEIVI